MKLLHNKEELFENKTALLNFDITLPLARLDMIKLVLKVSIKWFNFFR